jgi:acetylornithine deacetylase/succinyl-diaminopimelate desuccinylase-like protein
MQKALNWVNQNQQEIVDNVRNFLRIPSISAESEHAEDVIKAANWVKWNFERIGLEARLIETLGYPVVYAATAIDPSKPTVLCYFHYDVQPEGNASQWQYGAFEPTVFDEKIFGRGTTDDKMQGLIHAVALEGMIKSGEELPVNFKFCIEGEEEISSPNVGKVLEENRELFSCDYILISDGPMLSADQPSMVVGARGIVYTQIRLSVGIKDMHSGQFGGYVKNANFELAKILAVLKDDQGRVTIPGFYDGIIPPAPEEVAGWDQLEKADEEYRNEAGVYSLDSGEVGFSLLERNWTRPTLEVNGLWGGFTGEGAKTVIPFEARAKVSMRLVPGQDPDDIA